MSSDIRIGIDVGGTFTDLVAWDRVTGRVVSDKVLTTPANPAVGALEGIRRILESGFSPTSVTQVIHGTTLVSNTLIERTGAVAGLITTRGFKDVLSFRREMRYDVYDREIVFPSPLVPRRLRVEVEERIDGRGNVLVEMTTLAASGAVEALAPLVDSVAVVLLHSYRNPVHELMIRDALQALAPEVHVSLSHEVLPQIREFERASATAINAYVQPVIERYLGDLQAGLTDLGISSGLYMMTSSGGTIAAARAARFPIQLVESGPAAGVIMAAHSAASIGVRQVLGFDMGGTTAKICVIKEGRPLITRDAECARVRRFTKGSGLPVGVPMVDLLEIGAGGGSIAEIDATGLLRMGPRSAGADPGPACYGNGGEYPTVTDANLVLGFLDEDSFLGGEMLLDRTRAEAAIHQYVALPLAMTVLDAAAAMFRIVTENMAEAARVHSVDRNVDIRRFALLASGGGGGVHAYAVAASLRMQTIIVPPDAGVLSAHGLLRAPLAVEISRSFDQDLSRIDAAAVNALIGELETEARTLLIAAGAKRVCIERAVDMCYEGQGFELTTALPVDRVDGRNVALLKNTFDENYAATYGRRLSELPARCVTWRVVASDRSERPSLAMGRLTAAPAGSGRSRDVFFPGIGPLACAVVDRSTLAPGSVLSGPAIVQERLSTTVVPPGTVARVDDEMNLVLTGSEEEL